MSSLFCALPYIPHASKICRTCLRVPGHVCFFAAIEIHRNIHRFIFTFPSSTHHPLPLVWKSSLPKIKTSQINFSNSFSFTAKKAFSTNAIIATKVFYSRNNKFDRSEKNSICFCVIHEVIVNLSLLATIAWNENSSESYKITYERNNALKKFIHYELMMCWKNNFTIWKTHFKWFRKVTRSPSYSHLHSLFSSRA